MIAEREAIPRTALVEFKGVQYRYPRDDRFVFTDLDLSLQKGEFLTVVGPSGCGKSTLLRLAAGLLHPNAGDVYVDGRSVENPSHSTALVFQSETLLPWRTALKNVQLGIEGKCRRREAVDRSREMLQRVGLSEAEDKYPHELSGGMRQRVNLARALVVQPKILLMDEPFAALDAQTRERQQEHLLEIWRRYQKAVLFVTHQIDEAVFLGDRVVVLGESPRGVVDDFAVGIERPRDLSIKFDPLFGEMVKRVRAGIETGNGVPTERQEERPAMKR